MTPLCFIDTETTGVHPDRRVWEVAMIRRDDVGERELVMQVNDVDLSNADPFGLKVGGFYERAYGYGNTVPESTRVLSEVGVRLLRRAVDPRRASRRRGAELRR